MEQYIQTTHLFKTTKIVIFAIESARGAEETHLIRSAISFPNERCERSKQVIQKNNQYH